MKTKTKTKTSLTLNPDPVIYAAGGILVKEEDSGKKIALVHRPGKKHKDWSLPKGKPKKNEKHEHTAIREVGEETYMNAEITGFAGSISYKVNKMDKVVLFWYMKPTGPYEGKKADKTEVDDIVWLSPEKAVKKLTHKTESDFIKNLFFKKKPYYLKKRKKSIKYQRLAYSIKILRSQLDYIFKNDEEKRKSAWAHTANMLLNDSEQALLNRQIDEGWRCYHAARRMSIYGLDSEDLKHMSAIIRNESEKLTSWRKKSVTDLLGTRDNPAKSPNNSTVYHAALLRDDHFDNEYYKIGLFRGQIKLLSIMMLIIISAIIGYLLCVPSIEEYQVLIYPGIILFGLLGGTFSSAVFAGKSSDKSQIPEIVSNNYFTLLRIAIGGASAFIVFFFLKLDIIKVTITGLDQLNYYGFFIISFIAGFSEQLVVNAVRVVIGNKD